MKTFLVAVDDSPVARVVLEAASKYADAFDAQLVLLRVVGLPSEVPTNALTDCPDHVITLLVEEARRSLAELALLVPVHIVAHQRVELGVAWHSICETARRECADLVIIGSHGVRPIERLLGTTAARVVNHIDRPVLVVRPPEVRRDLA